MVNRLPGNALIVEYRPDVTLIFIKGRKDTKYRPYKLKYGEEFTAHDILTVDNLFEFLELDRLWLENNLENHGIYHKKKIITMIYEMINNDLVNSSW